MNDYLFVPIAALIALIFVVSAWWMGRRSHSGIRAAYLATIAIVVVGASLLAVRGVGSAIGMAIADPQRAGCAYEQAIPGARDGRGEFRIDCPSGRDRATAVALQSIVLGLVAGGVAFVHLRPFRETLAEEGIDVG